MTVEALSRLQASQVASSDLDEEDARAPARHVVVTGDPDEEFKHDRTADEFVYDTLLGGDGKPNNSLNEDIEAYNRKRNHFSKSTADESDIGGGGRGSREVNNDLEYDLMALNRSGNRISGNRVSGNLKSSGR